MELQLWLAEDFGLQLDKFISMLDILGAGNNLLSKWSSFLKQKVGTTLQDKGLFPVKLQIPLNYSLYFNIEFKNFQKLEKEITKDAIQTKDYTIFH